MSGIYIHIPFCSQACHYCDFHFSTVLKNKQPLLDAMVNEIQLRKQELKLNFTSLYFGGGTPSLLNKKEITQILKALSKHVSINKLKEITIEINPEDISYEKLSMYKDLGFNRLSIGIQSLEDRFLKWMNRVHTKKQVLEAISLTQKTGFDNISLDFIYGVPKQLNRNYSKALKEIMSLADEANQYVDKNEPWILNKDVANKERVHTISSTAINLFRILNLYLEPVIPETSLKIKNYLKCKKSIVNIRNILVNHEIESFEPLIIRVEDEEISRVKEASTNG